VASLSSSWAFAFLISSLHDLTRPLYSSGVACPFFHRWQTLLFFLSPSKSSVFSQAGHPPHRFVLRHMGTACSCALKTSSWKNVRPAWTPLPFSTLSHGTLSTSVLNRPKSALRKSMVVVLLAPLSSSPQTESSVISWLLSPRWPPTTTSPTSPSLSVNSRSSKALPLVGSLTCCLRTLSATHSRNLLACFLSAVSYFQQMSVKLKSPTENKGYRL